MEIAVKRLWSLRGSCALVLMALGTLGILVSACDSSSPPASSSPVVPVSTQAASATDTPDPGDVASGLLTNVPFGDTPTAIPSPEGLTDSEANGIYATVVDALLGEKVPPVVYISPYVGQGERLDDPDESRPIDQSLLSALTPVDGTRYEIADFSKVTGPLEDGGKVENNGAFITLGAIEADPADPNGTIVRGSIYRKVGDAEGDRFRITRDSPSEQAGRRPTAPRNGTTRDRKSEL